MAPPQSFWDSDDMVDIYGSDVDREIADAAGLEDPLWPHMIRQVIQSMPYAQTDIISSDALPAQVVNNMSPVVVDSTADARSYP